MTATITTKTVKPVKATQMHTIAGITDDELGLLTALLGWTTGELGGGLYAKMRRACEDFDIPATTADYPEEIRP